MELLREIRELVRRDLRIEWRKRHQFGAVLLYALSTIFVCYLSFERVIELSTWNALFWIIVLFATFNTVSRNFEDLSVAGRSYLHQLASPQAIILGKMLYNALVLAVIVGASALFYGLFIGSGPPVDARVDKLILALLLAVVGLSSSLTLIGAIASKGNGHSGLVAVLGLPVVLPLLTLLVRFSHGALKGHSWSHDLHYLLALLALDVLVIALSFILFPYIWRD